DVADDTHDRPQRISHLDPTAERRAPGEVSTSQLARDHHDARCGGSVARAERSTLEKRNADRRQELWRRRYIDRLRLLPHLRRRITLDHVATRLLHARRGTTGASA